MKTIGVLGGMGPQATMDFEARVHAIVQRDNPTLTQNDYPPLVVYYHRGGPVLMQEDGSPVFPIQPHPALLNAASKLGAWVDFLVITSNGAHLVQEAIQKQTSCKILSMIEATLQEVRRREWSKVGVLTFRMPTVYAVPLQQLGIAYETLPQELAERLDQAIMRVWVGQETAQDREVTKEAISLLRARGIDGVILGCTEIPLLLQEEAPDLINPLQLLAEAAVAYARE